MEGIALKLFIFTMFIVGVMCAGNATTVAHDTPAPKPMKDTKATGVLASLGRMFIDIPLGFVEAFKDGAQLIESLVATIVRGIFS